jgi:hypothetical protein
VLAWAAASGGALGRRRGASSGRQLAWWALQALTGLDEEPLDDPAAVMMLGEATSGLRFVRFDDGAPDTGWALRIAVEDPVDGLAWAIAAIDSR